MDWIGDAASYLLDGIGVLGSAAGLLAIAAAVRGWYRRTLGRRRDRYDRLARLGTGAQLSFFEAVLGEPPAIRTTITKDDYREVVSVGDPRFDPALATPDDPSHQVEIRKEFTECFFIDRDYYVQTISDDDETVLAFSVTSRRRRFRPVFEVPSRVGRLDRLRWRRESGEKYEPLLRVQLRRTRFADLDATDPDHYAPPHFKVVAGARPFWYSEFHSFGNPGDYQTYVVTASYAAGRAPVGQAWSVQEEIGERREWPDPNEDEIEPDWEDMPVTQRFRRESVITTYTVIGPRLWEVNYPSTFGPHGDEVRTLP